MISFFRDWLFGWLLDYFPTFVGKFINVQSLVQENLHIQWSGNHNVEVRLNQGVPTAQVFLQFTNKAPFKIVLDRMQVRLDVGNSSGKLIELQPLTLQPRQTYEFFPLRVELSEAQKQSIIGQIRQDGTLLNQVRADVFLLVRTKMGVDVSIRKQMDCYRPEIIN